MGPTIHTEGLTLFRNEQRVLDQVSMNIAAGELVCLLGPSGAGKSSLLRCINRLSEPPVGTVFIGNNDVTDSDVLILRRQVGMVFQKITLFPGSVSDNLDYGLSLQDQSLSETEIKHLLELADLPADLAVEDSHTLSGGQAQRVAIARALATQPSALLLDEPTSSLDPAASKHVEETMLKLRQQLGITQLWVTHDPAQAERVADRVYLLNKGQIVDEGVPDHLFREGSRHLTAAFASGELD